MRLIKLDSQGLTLIELLVTCTLISIISILMVSFLGDWTAQHAVSQTRTELLTNAQNSLDRITDVVRLSAAADTNNRIEDTYAPGAPGNLFSWASDADTIVLASAVEDASGSIVFSDPLSYTSQKNNHIFFVSNGRLYQRILASEDEGNILKTSCPESASSTECPADRMLAENVQSFVVKYYNGDNQEVTPTDARSVEVSITLQKQTYKQTVNESYNTRMVFRND